jgi:hypothetical protein
LNLPPIPTKVEIEEVEFTPEESSAIIEENRDAITKVDRALTMIDAAMPAVRELDATDQEMDEIAKMAIDQANEMISLGMNVDPRFSGVILQTASQMMGHAITAKTAKIDRKLKTIQLQLQKAKLDAQLEKDAAKSAASGEKSALDGKPIDGKGILLDRNELLRQILDRQNDKK